MAELTKAAEEAAKEAAAHASRLVLYARQWLDPALAQDAVQEALVSLLSQSTPPRDTLAWMYRTVRNAAIDAARSAGRRKRREQLVAETRREWFQSPAESRLDAHDAQAALEKLPPELREIVVLRIWGELGFAQIADIVQSSVGSVHARFGDALKQLRASLNGKA
jgi:RNA polymerase sigma factor (sigma-70 family)